MDTIRAYIADPWFQFAFGILVLVVGWKLTTLGKLSSRRRRNHHDGRVLPRARL